MNHLFLCAVFIDVFTVLTPDPIVTAIVSSLMFYTLIEVHIL